MAILFPRFRDKKRHAWGLQGKKPEAVWERFSASYEAMLERLVLELERQEFKVTIDGAGGEDGEFVFAKHADGRSIFRHFEDPKEARELASVKDEDYKTWLNNEIHLSK